MANFRVVKTTMVFVAGIIIGNNMGVITTTIPDLEVLTNSSTAEIATSFIWVGLASIVGVLVIGPQFDRINDLLLLGVCFILVGVFIALAPTWHNLPSYQAMIALVAVFYIAIMSGCLSISRNTWKSSEKWLRPIIQLTSLTVMLGTAFGPQVARPFVGHHDVELSNDLGNISTSANVTADYQRPTFYPVKYAYLISGVLDVAMGCVCLITWICTSISSGRCRQGLGACLRNSPEDDDIQLIPDNSEKTSTCSSDQQPSTDDRLEPCSRQGCVLLALMYVFFVMTAGRDVMFTGLLYTYIYEYLGWTVNSATLLVTMYHVTRFVSGAIAVPVSHWVTPTRLNVFNLATLLASSLLMLGALYDGDALTAVGVIVTGVAESNVHPTTITMIEETIYVVAPVMAMIVSAFGVSMTLIGPLSGLLLHMSATTFPLLLLVLTIVAFVTFVVYCVFVKVSFSGKRNYQRTE